MAILHYSYLTLKMSEPCGIISIKGDVEWAFDCNRVSCETTDRLLASVDLQELKQALAESPPPHLDSVMPQGQDFQDVHPTRGHTQQDNLIVHGGII
jgi:hypothetical protein